MLKSLKKHQLALEFSRGNARQTYIARQFASYPFHVCRPFWLENDPAGMATLYVQSCAGGLYGGDQLSSFFRTREGAFAHVTTQASTIVHALEGENAFTEVAVHADQESFLEVFNEPLILFPHASVENLVSIACAKSSTVLYSDAFLVHDPAGLGGTFGTLDSTVSVTFEGEAKPSVMDKMRLNGTVFRKALPGASGGWSVHGTLYVISKMIDASKIIKRGVEGARVPDSSEIYLGGSELPFSSGLMFRIAASGAVAYRIAMGGLWAAIREDMFGIPPQPRRK